MAGIVKIFDIFGNNFTPTVAYTSKQKSTFGGVFGLIYFALIPFLAYQFGSNLYYKDIPFLIMKTVVDKNNTANFNLELSYTIDVTPKVVFFMDNAYTAQEKTEDHNYVKTNLFKIFTVLPIYKNLSETEKLSFRPCNASKFEDITPDEAKKVSDLQCIDYQEKNYQISRKLNDPLGTGFQYLFLVCENSTEHICLNTNEQNNILERYDFKITFYFNLLSIDPNLINTPFSRYYEYTKEPVVLNPLEMHKTTRFNIQKYVLKTDTGWFFKDITTDEAINVASREMWFENILYHKHTDGIYRKKFQTISVAIIPEAIHIERSYIRVQDILANVAGVLSVFAFLLKLFLKNIYDNVTKELILHQLFHIDETIVNNDEIYKRISCRINQSDFPGIKEIELKSLPLSQNDNEIDITLSLNRNNNIEYSKNNSAVNNVNDYMLKKESKNIIPCYEKKVILVNKESNSKINSKSSSKSSNKSSSKSTNEFIYSSPKLINNQNINHNNVNNLYQNYIDLKYINEGNINQASNFVYSKKKYLSLSWLKAIPLAPIPSVASVFHENDIQTNIQPILLAKKNLEEISKLNQNVTKEKYTIVNEKKLLLSLWDHFILTYFSCCKFGRLKRISHYYDNFQDHILEYTDILNFTNNIREMEKLKYLLFDEDQVALFNLRTKLHLNTSKSSSNFSDYIFYTKDLNDELNIEEIKKAILKRNKKKLLNKNLVSLCL